MIEQIEKALSALEVAQKETDKVRRDFEQRGWLLRLDDDMTRVLWMRNTLREMITDMTAIHARSQHRLQADAALTATKTGAGRNAAPVKRSPPTA